MNVKSSSGLTQVSEATMHPPAQNIVGSPPENAPLRGCKGEEERHLVVESDSFTNFSNFLSNKINRLETYLA